MMNLYDSLRNINEKHAWITCTLCKYTKLKTLFECEKEHYIMIFFQWYFCEMRGKWLKVALVFEQMQNKEGEGGKVNKLT